MNNGKEDFTMSNQSEEFSARDAEIIIPIVEEEIIVVQNTSGNFDSRDNSITIPVIQEEIKVAKEVIDTAVVNISKTIKESTELIDIPLSSEEIIVTRVPKNEFIDTIPAASRYEGDVMIIPVLKEVAVVEKRMMLVEEIHISKNISEKVDTQEVVVRKEEVNITRTDL